MQQHPPAVIGFYGVYNSSSSFSSTSRPSPQPPVSVITLY